MTRMTEWMDQNDQNYWQCLNSPPVWFPLAVGPEAIRHVSSKWFTGAIDSTGWYWMIWSISSSTLVGIHHHYWSSLTGWYLLVNGQLNTSQPVMVTGTKPAWVGSPNTVRHDFVSASRTEQKLDNDGTPNKHKELLFSPGSCRSISNKPPPVYLAMMPCKEQFLWGRDQLWLTTM